MMEEEALESVEVIIVAQDSIDDIKTEELMVAPVVYDDVLQDHDYSMTESNFNHEKVTKEFAKTFPKKFQNVHKTFPKHSKKFQKHSQNF